ncbi:MAG: HAD family hydrolase [Ruminococcus sp.]|nr:HAD family hydrolase [Ruminococcus sp.]
MSIKVVVFDIGGTLMEYRDMPNSWVDFYPKAFDHVNEKLALGLTEDELEKSREILLTYNPRLHYRERDFSPEHIFKDVTADWEGEFTINDVINAFFESMKLVPYLFPESIAVLEKLHEQGIKTAALTDVACGMPDEMQIGYFSDVMPYFDEYVSSVNCGYRKPSPVGLERIAERFGADKSEMIFVGDEEKDIKTADRFGCKSVLIDRKHSGKNFGQTHTITALTELFPILI